jgi:alanine racemase
MISYKSLRPVWAEINLDNLEHNIREVNRIISDETKIMAVVKADAYGHGAIPCSKIFLENGADRLAVATITEAIELRKSTDKPILVLGYTPIDAFTYIIDYNIAPTIYNIDQARALNEISIKKFSTTKIHIKIDTGMGRLGFQPSLKNIDIISIIDKFLNIEVEGIFTHFAVSDITDKTYTHKQFEKYQWVLEELEKKNINIPLRHVSNSAAIIDLPEYNLDLVRPGIMLYGIYPSDEVKKERVNLKPVMALKARVAHLKKVTPGSGISYGLTYFTEEESKIATLPIGYADGYHRRLSNKGKVRINGREAPLIGRICMDQCMIDVTDMDNIMIGDEVILFGDGSKVGTGIGDISRWLNTIPHEIMCGISRRVPRLYIRKNTRVEVNDYLMENEKFDVS